ncbi:cyclin-dependent kinase inhibitor 4-like protein [Carex littledalei]|uniref:Cyclin-dependent kinase inhibitor n=1 Tax=Carex littledalei TaxID=544730 RepID=A0A833QIP5_9POAL|nr:cyclin-dependent kinase inhibitor 4-like protein [Carex littledalei]
MGRYMRKGKLSGEVAVMEISLHTPLGVQTRSRTLALQKQNPKSTSISNASPPSPVGYLELRNRRLEKHLPLVKGKGNLCHEEGLITPEKGSAANSCSIGSFSPREKSGRNTRESTPCSWTRDGESFGTPCSTTRSQSGFRVDSSRHGVDVPSPYEVEEFFARVEQYQCQSFMDKYNFDPVNEAPLAGRYEWVKVDS